MDFSPSDIVSLVVILAIVIIILNDSGWGGGRRARVTADLPVPSECAT